MKTLITTIVTILISASLFSQKIGDKILVTEVTDLYAESSIMAKSIKLQIDDIITILQKENEKGYYQVSFKNDTGYVSSPKISQFIKFQNPEYRKANEKIKAWKESRINDIAKYISLYGEPTSTSDYTSGDYVSKTLVWHCAKGKYRSVDFLYKDGNWIKESEYASDCI